MPKGDITGIWLLSTVLATSLSTNVQRDETYDRELAVRARYEQALLSNPSRGTAFERLYQSYIDSEGTTAWRERLQQLIATNPTQAAATLILGFLCERQGEDESALEAYAEAERREPKNHRAPSARGRLLIHLRRYDEAVAALARSVSLKPPRQELQDLYKLLGQTYALQGNMEQAKDTWRELAELFPRDATVIEELAELLVDEGQLDEAIGHYERLRALTEDDYVKVRIGHEIAELRLRQDKLEDATALLRELLDNLAPDSWLRAETRRRLEDAYRSSGDLDGLVQFYDEWLQARTDDIELRLALADVYRERGQTSEAVACYEEVLRRAGSRRLARQGLASLYLDQGRYGDAAEELRKAAESAPHEASLWEQLGGVLFDDLTRSESERRERACDAWRHIAAERPNDPFRAVRAAEVFRSHKLERLALEHYQRAIDLAPENTVYYEYIGEYLYQLGRKDEAVARWRELVAGRRATVASWLRLAEIFAGFGYAHESLEATAEGLRLVPDGPDAFKLLALESDVLLDQDRFDEAAGALDHLERCAESTGQQREVMERRVKWAQRAGRIPSEIARLTRELDRAPLSANDAPRLELLARMHNSASHSLDAVQAIERAIELDARSSDRLKLAVALYRQAGNTGRAIEMLQRLIELDPRQESSQLEEIADLARRHGDFAGAIAAAERLIELAPEDLRGYVLASDLNWQAGRAEAAVAALRRGIRRMPKELSLHAHLARRLMDSGQLRLALDQYWRTYEVAEEPNQKLQIVRDLTRAHISTGQFDRLVDRLIERRRDSHDQCVTTLALATAYWEGGQIARAEQELLRALAARPTDTVIVDQLIRLAEEQENTERGILYTEKLVSLRPGDSQALRRLGELLYQAGRVDDAIARWNASSQAKTKDPAENALQLAETLTAHGLVSEAQQTLLDAATRYPDDWRITFALGIIYQKDGQLERARTQFDRILSSTPPSVELTGGPLSQNPSYLRHAACPIAMRQWLNLRQIQGLAAQDFASEPFGNHAWFIGSRGYTAGFLLSYYPPDFDSCQFAALVHRLFVAEQEGDLSQYLTGLARRAGYDLVLRVTEGAEPKQAAGSLDEPTNIQPPRSAATSARLPSTAGNSSQIEANGRATGRPTDPHSRSVLLKALLCVYLADEAFDAARQFAQESPDDFDSRALLAVLATVPDGAAVSRYVAGAGQQAFAFGLDRPETARLASFQVEPLIASIAERQPQAALAVSLPHAIGLIARQQKPDAVRWLQWTLDQKPPVEIQVLCLQLLIEADRADEAVRRLPAVRTALQQALRQSAPLSTVAASLNASGQQQFTPGQVDSAELALHLARVLFDHREQSGAIDLLIDSLNATAAAGLSGSPNYAGYSPIFVLSRTQPAPFPSPNSLVDERRLVTLKDWYGLLEAAGTGEELIRRLQQRLAEQSGQAVPAKAGFGVDSRSETVMILATLDALAGRMDAARDRLAQAADAYDDDRLRVVLAQILLHQDQPEHALRSLQQVGSPIGPLLQDSLVGQLQVAERLGNDGAAIQAAQRLFGLRLTDSDADLLQSHLRRLGLNHQLTQLLTRTANGPVRGGMSQLSWRTSPVKSVASRRVELIKQFLTEQNSDGAIGLARRIIAEQARSADSSDERGELAAAINALEQTESMDAEIARLELALAQELEAPSGGRDSRSPGGIGRQGPDTRQGIEALDQLKILYAVTGDTEKLARVHEQLFAARPDNVQLRWQRALGLVSNAQPAEAVDQFDWILRESPWVIDDARWLIVAYDQTNQLERLIDRLIAIKPVRRLSVRGQSVSLGWLASTANELEERHAQQALRLHRRQRELAAGAAEWLQQTQAILRMLLVLNRADEVLAEFARLTPTSQSVPSHDTGSPRQWYDTVASSLFSLEVPTQRQHWIDSARSAPLMAALVDLVAQHGKLDSLEQLVAEGAKESAWADVLGRPCQVLIDLAKQPPVTQLAQQVLADYENMPVNQDSAAEKSRGSIQRCLIIELSRDPQRLPFAARLAAYRMNVLRPQRNAYKEKLQLLTVIARAAIEAGDGDQARAAYRELAKLEDPRYGRAHHGESRGWEAFQSKRRAIEQIRDDGFYDVAMQALLDVVDQHSEGDWSLQPCEQLLAEWTRPPAAKVEEDTAGSDARAVRGNSAGSAKSWAAQQCAAVLQKRIEATERQMAERPLDFTLANRLVRYYRASGQTDLVTPLLLRVATMPGVSNAQLAELADELYRLGSAREARDILLQLVHDGSTDWARYSWRYRTRFNSLPDAERLAATLEALPRESRYIQNGDDWIVGFAAELDEAAHDRLPAARRQLLEASLRINRVADSFSAVAAAGPTGTKSRDRLETVATSLERLGRPDEAFDLLMRSIFDAKHTGLPEPRSHALFGEYEFSESNRFIRGSPWGSRIVSGLDPSTESPAGLAGHLSWLARKTGNTESLRRAIMDRQKTDPPWIDTALRFRALLAMETGSAQEAKPILEEILARPSPPSLDGIDGTLMLLAMRAAKLPSLLPVACKLQAKLVDASWANPVRGEEDALMSPTTQLIALYQKTGDRAAATALLKRLVDYSRRYSTAERDTLRMHLAMLQVECGSWNDAVELLRQSFVASFHNASSVSSSLDATDSDLPDERRTHAFVKLLVKLRSEQKLEILLNRARDDWKRGLAQPAGKRNCEPLITWAACHLLLGQYGAAREAMAALDEKDAAPTGGLLVDALGESPRPADGLDIVDGAFVRWPYLFEHAGQKLAILHVRAGLPLPLRDPRFIRYLEQLSKAKAKRDEDAADAVGVVGAGVARLNWKQQRGSTAAALSGIASVLAEANRLDEYLVVAEWLLRNLDDKQGVFHWLSLLAQTDPAAAYAWCRQTLGIDSNHTNRSEPKRPLLDEGDLFSDRVGERVLALPAGKLAEWPRTLADLMIQLAQQSNKLDELIDDCERIIAGADAPGARVEVIQLAPIVSRLHLLALIAREPSRSSEMLELFRLREGAFRLSRADNRRQNDDLDIAFWPVVEACARVPSLRGHAVLLIADQIEKQRRHSEAGRGARHAVHGSDFRMRLAEIQFEAGQRDAAIRTVCDLLADHMRLIVNSGGVRDVDLPAVLERNRALAERYDAAPELIECLRSLRATTTEHPGTDHKLAAAERSLRVIAGERVTPGIVLAVQASGTDRLQLIWQLHNRVPDVPAQELDFDESLPRPHERLVISVPFVGADEAIAPDSYDVLIESSVDRRQFTPLELERSTDGGLSVAGAYWAELAAKPGDMRWYRASLRKAGKVVATSRAVAGVAGQNLLDAGSFSAEIRSDSSMPAGWQIPTWWLGRPELRSIDLPAAIGVPAVRSVAGDALRLESRQSLALDTRNCYLISGWSVSEPPAGTAGQPLASRSGRRISWATRKDGEARLAFVGAEQNLLSDARMDMSAQTQITFSQLVVMPSQASAPTTADDALYSPTGQNVDRLPDDARAILCSIDAAPHASLSRLAIVPAQAPGIKGELKAKTE